MSIALKKGDNRTILDLRSEQEKIQKDIKKVKKQIEYGCLNKKEKKQAKNLLSRLLDENHFLEEQIKKLSR